jgi:hypothetical protein
MNCRVGIACSLTIEIPGGIFFERGWIPKAAANEVVQLVIAHGVGARRDSTVLFRSLRNCFVYARGRSNPTEQVHFAIGKLATTIFHLVGSYRIGIGEHAVSDHQLRGTGLIGALSTRLACGGSCRATLPKAADMIRDGL